MVNIPPELIEWWKANSLDPRIETLRIRHLEKSVPEINAYDIFLTSDIDNPSTRERKDELLSAVEKLCLELGHRAFVPYRFVGFPKEKEMSDRDVYVLINDIMVPRASLVLGYIGEGSDSNGTMIAKAMLLRKDIIYFFEKGTQHETVEETLSKIKGGGFHRETDLEILRSPRIFYHRDKPNQLLTPYSSLFGVVNFKSTADCIDQLRPKIEDYFGKTN